MSVHRFSLRPRVVHASATLIFVLAASCVPGQQAVQPSARCVHPEQASKIWIFNAAQTDSTFDRVGRCGSLPFDSIDGSWTPGRAAVERIDRLTRSRVDVARGNRTALNGADYHIQYFGVVVGNRRLVYINGVHGSLATRMLRNPERELADGPVAVCDAGLGAFQSQYDTQTEQLGSIRFESSYGGILAPP